MAKAVPIAPQVMVLGHVNYHLGRRLRRRPPTMGLIQQALGVGCGLRFQQVQKCDCGADRMSAARLWQIAQYLNVPVAYFYGRFAETLRCRLFILLASR